MRNAIRLFTCAALAAGVVTLAMSTGANAELKKYTFGYDQPHSTAYGIAGDMFNAKLMELSKGTMGIDQFPGAQLGQEPVMLQKIRTGDIDFIITSTANAASVAPQAGVFSEHFIFRDKGHLTRVLADPAVTKEFQAMIADSVKGAHVLGLMTMGLRNMYTQEPDPLGRRRQGQEDPRAGDDDRGRAFPGLRRADRAYAVRRGLHLAADRRRADRRERRQRLHGQQALRSGADPLDDRARSQQQLHLGLRQGLEQPHAPSKRAGSKRPPPKSPRRSRPWRSSSRKIPATKLKKMGVTINEKVDKSGFMKDAKPIQDEIAKKLGPHAVKLLELVREVK